MFFPFSIENELLTALSHNKKVLAIKSMEEVGKKGFSVIMTKSRVKEFIIAFL
jgi:hypothetical protein